MITKKFNEFVSITTTGENFVEAFEQMATLQDLFESCPLEESNGDFRFRVRDVEKDGESYRYYELEDIATGARLSLGQFKEKGKKGLLFPKRKNKEGEWLPNRGWVKWESKSEEKPAAKATGKSKKSDVGF